MQIFKKNISLNIKKRNYNIISGIEFLSKTALNNGIDNIFFDGEITSLLPEIPEANLLKIYSDTNFLWTSIYSLSLANKRAMGFAYDRSFFNFTNLEKYFTDGKNINGGIVIFLFKKKGVKKAPYALESIFPIYNYCKISDFLQYMHYYFELSEKLKLPVLIYLNDSVMNEYIHDEKREYFERTATKPRLFFGDSENGNAPTDVKQNIQFFKNTGSHIKLFKKENANNLVLTDAKYFHRIVENDELSKNSDIILFNLLNPFDSVGFKKLLKDNCRDFYKNIYVFDDYTLLRRQLPSMFLEDDKPILKYKSLKLIKMKTGDGIMPGFCIDDFKMTEVKTPSSFCVGCNMFIFLQNLEKKIDSNENYILIGDKNCFPLLHSSALRFSFQNILIIDDPLYFTFNLSPKDLAKTFYVFISSLKFSEQIEKFDNKDGMIFVIYKSIYDFDCDMESLMSHPLLKNVKKAIIKKGSSLKDSNVGHNASVIFIDNDCKDFAKSGRNLNYTAYLHINSRACDKFECKLCYQKTKCPAIKIDNNKSIVIDAEICNFCRLCIDICPHNAIKSKRRKRVKVRKSLENKINL